MRSLFRAKLILSAVSLALWTAPINWARADPAKSPTNTPAAEIPVSGSAANGFPGKGNRLEWGYALQYYNQGNHLLEDGRYDEAIQQYQEAIARYNEDADFYTNMGLAYRKLDDYVNAEAAFRRASKLSPKDWVPWSNLANALLKQNRLRDSIAALNAGLKCNPPAKEKANMLRDIADMTKFLKMTERKAAPVAAAVGKAKPGSRVKGDGSLKTSAAPTSANPQPVPNIKVNDTEWGYK